MWLTPVDSYRRTATISVLPDNILLEIFCLYRDYDRPYREDTHPVWGWYLLVHICRRWRQVVFASPLRLDLRIFSTSRNLVGKNLAIWPALPIIVDFDFHSNRRHGNNASSEDNIIAALEHADRVCEVGLCATRSEFGEVYRGDAGAVSDVEKSPHLVRECTGPSHRIFGRICTMFTANPFGRNSLSGITNASFVHH